MTRRSAGDLDRTSRTLRRARAAVGATFATHAVVAGSLGPWIPQLKSDSDLDAAGLGFALTGFAIGLVAGTRLAGPALRLAGGRTVVRVGIPLLAAGLALLPLANELASLGAVFVAFGLAGGLLDVAMNAEAVAVERRFGRLLMSAMHGTWSLSVLAGAAIASIAVAAGIAIEAALPLVAATLVVASFPLLRWLPSSHDSGVEVATEPAARRSAGWVVLLCLVGSAAFLSEGVATEWSALFLREVAGAGPGVAGLGVVAFSAGMAASRFAGDPLAARFEAAMLARLGAMIGVASLAVAIGLADATISIVAFAVLGLGLGPVVPLAFRAAGALGLGVGRTALGVVVTAGYVGSIVGPLAVGLVADRVGLRAAFAVPMVACAVVAIASGAIRGR